MGLNFRHFSVWHATALLLALGACTHGTQEVSQRQQEVVEPVPAPTPEPSGSVQPPATLPMLPLAPYPAKNPATSRLVAKARKHASAAEWDLAQTALDRAYRIAPRDPMITETKARLLFSQKKFVEAESWAQRTLVLLKPDQYLAMASAWEIIEASRRATGRTADADVAQAKRQEILRESSPGPGQ